MTKKTHTKTFLNSLNETRTPICTQHPFYNCNNAFDVGNCSTKATFQLTTDAFPGQTYSPHYTLKVFKLKLFAQKQKPFIHETKCVCVCSNYCPLSHIRNFSSSVNLTIKLSSVTWTRISNHDDGAFPGLLQPPPMPVYQQTDWLINHTTLFKWKQNWLFCSEFCYQSYKNMNIQYLTFWILVICILFVYRRQRHHW